MKKLLIYLPLMLGLLFSSCRKEMDISAPPSNLKMLAQFKFTKADNPALKGDVTGVINEAQKTITVTMPLNTVVTSLKPALIIAPLSTVSPGNLEPIDFTQPVNYTVTAQNKTSIYYTVTIVFK